MRFLTTMMSNMMCDMCMAMQSLCCMACCGMENFMESFLARSDYRLVPIRTSDKYIHSTNS